MLNNKDISKGSLFDEAVQYGTYNDSNSLNDKINDKGLEDPKYKSDQFDHVSDAYRHRNRLEEPYHPNKVSHKTLRKVGGVPELQSPRERFSRIDLEKIDEKNEKNVIPNEVRKLFGLPEKTSDIYDRIRELKALKRIRPLTDNEDEELTLAQGTALSNEAEKKYLDGESDDPYWYY